MIGKIITTYSVYSYFTSINLRQRVGLQKGSHDSSLYPKPGITCKNVIPRELRVQLYFKIGNNHTVY